MRGEENRALSVGLILGLILLLGLYLRISGLSQLGLGFDEPLHIFAAKSLIETGAPTLPSGIEYRRAYLFTYLVALSFKLLGVNVFAARLPSVVFGLLSILLMFQIGRSFFGTRVGLVVALLMAFVPHEVAWARACRMYSMYQFFYLATFYALYMTFENQKNYGEVDRKRGRWKQPFSMALVAGWDIDWRWLVVSGLLFVTTLHLHMLGALLVLSLLNYVVLMLMVTVIVGKNDNIYRSQYFAISIVMCCAVLISLFIPGVLHKLLLLKNFSPQWGKYIGVSPVRYFKILINHMLFPITVFFVIGTVQLLSRFNKRGLYIIVFVATPLFVHSFLVGVQGWRYIYDIFPLILLVSSYAIYSFLQSETKVLFDGLGFSHVRNNLRPMLYVLFVGVFIGIVSIPFFYTVYDALKLSRNQVGNYGAEYHARWDQACQFLKKSQLPGDVIIASIPMAAMFNGCGDIQYKLDNGGLEQFRHVSGERMLLDPFSKAKAITNLRQLKEVLSENPQGWLLVDSQRFANPSTIPPEVRKFVENNLPCRFDAAGTVLVYTWNSRVLLKAYHSSTMPP